MPSNTFQERNKWISSNMKWVRSVVVAKFKWALHKFTLDDLIQEAVIGICKAWELYDPSKSSFKTYSSLWIRAYVGRAIEREIGVSHPSWGSTKYVMMSLDSPPTSQRSDEWSASFLDSIGVAGVQESQAIKSQRISILRSAAHDVAIRSKDLRLDVLANRRFFSNDQEKLEDVGHSMHVTGEMARLLEKKLVVGMKASLKRRRVEFNDIAEA